MTILEEAKAVIADWNNPDIARPAIAQESPREVRFAYEIVKFHRRFGWLFEEENWGIERKEQE